MFSPLLAWFSKDAHASYEEDGKELSMPFVGGVQPGSLTLGDRFQEMGYATHLNGRLGWPSRAVYRISFKVNKDEIDYKGSGASAAAPS